MFKPSRRWLALPAALVLALPVTACESGGEEAPAANQPATTTAPPSAAAPADTGLYFYPPVEGATLEYKLGGVVSGTTSVTVDSVTEGSGGRTVTVTEKGTAPAAEREFVTRADGGLTIDIGAFAASAAGFTVEGAGEDVTVHDDLREAVDGSFMPRIRSPAHSRTRRRYRSFAVVAPGP